MKSKKQEKQPAQDGFSLISDETLLALYAALLKCRMIDRKLGASAKQDESSLGAAVGVAIDLLAGDVLAASHAGAMVRLVKSSFAGSAALRRILASRSVTNARNERHLPDAAALKTVLRKARAGKGEERTRIAVAFCGGPSIEPELWRKPLRAADKKRLPIVFVASAIPESVDVDSFVLPRGFPAIVVDSNDVVAIYRVASEAIAHARRGNGPTLILCKPWPLETKAHNAIRNMEKYLAGKRLFSPAFKRKTVSAFSKELSARPLPESVERQ